MSGLIIEFINKFGVFFCNHGLRMLIQSSILIIALLAIDLLIRKHVKAVLRYSIWLLVFIKLITPTTLSLPTSLGYWLGDLFPEKAAKKQLVTQPQEENIAGYIMSPQTLPQIENYKPVTNVPAAYTPVTETPVITPASPTIKIQGVLFLGWIVGELILFALLLQRTFFVKRIIAQSKPASSKLQDILNESCQIVGTGSKIELNVSQSLQSPAACGLLKPKIIFPSALLKCFSSEKLRTTMLHELAHIKRKDIWINSLQTFLQIFYFYNPLLWIANVIVRRTREQAVDETVLVYLGEKADTYSSTLVDIAEIAFAKPSLGMNMIGVVESKKALTGRIRHILSRPFPKKVKLGISGLALIIITAFVLIPMAKAERTNSLKTYTANELVDKIIASENTIQNMEAHCNINELQPEGDKLLWTYDWGYENSKEYQIQYNLKNDDAPEIEQVHTFDGNVQMVMNYDTNRNNYGVMIQKYNGTFHGMPTPKMLLGYSLNYLAQESLGNFISKAKELRVQEERENIDGHSCIVLEAIGLQLIDDHEYETWRDVRIWIDTERDFRPLKMETYKSYGDNKPYAGNKRWSIIEERLDNIELTKIDGIWFPVKGDREVFSIKDYLPPEGMTRKEFQEAYAESGLSEKQIREKLTPILEPMVEKRRIEITDIKINKGIPEKKFTIELLDGYTVYDEFLDKSYTVGEPSEEEVFISDDEVLAEIHDLSPAELVKLIHTERLGQNNKKWMAVIYRLAEIGPSALPDIVEELEKTDTPIKQSKLALALRTIGDPNAVPSLCNALERCVNSSDYGFGEVHSDSKIEMFYRRYQVKPEDKSLGLGRPVREITIALERLTGHSEGHDHFNAYDAEGNQLGSYIITPEIVDRQKEHRKKVAQQWRTWWQENKDSVEPTPAPAEIPVNPDTKRAPGGVLAAPEGAMIGFAIVPNIGDSSKQPNISYEQNQKYLNDMEEDGPYLGALRGDSFQWEMAMQGYSQFDGLTTGTYKNRTFVLTGARANYVMRPVVENKRLWSLEEVGPAIDAQGKPAVYIRFDEKGAELFAEFTQANIGNRMTISMDYFGIVSIPYIMSALGSELIITGDFTDEQVSEMVDRLQKGMVVEQVSPELIQAAEEIKKDEILNMSPDDFVRNLLIVGFAGDAEKLSWFMPEESDLTNNLSVDDFTQITAGDKVKVVDAYSDGDYALVITSEIKAKNESDTDENGQLVFFLEKQEGIWRIDEIDITNLRSAQWFIDHFKEKHPNAKAKEFIESLNPTDLNLSETSISEPIYSGFFFFKGKYIELPYIVKRQGVDIYINDVLVNQGPKDEVYDYSVDEDPGNPPPGISPFDSAPEGTDRRDNFYLKKSRYLYSHYDNETAKKMIFEMYKKCTELENVRWNGSNAITVFDKKREKELIIFLSNNYTIVDVNQQKKKLIERIEKTKRQYEKQLLNDSLSFEFDGFSLEPRRSDGLDAIKILLSDENDSEKFTKLDQVLYHGIQEQLPWIVTNFEYSHQLEERIRLIEAGYSNETIAEMIKNNKLQ
ncbi:MAG: hypothetical protein JXA96_04285 [Sedimentisphaerales bacterium]|nr:hypothetical protein [Sedimentisphaerales bacterium]